MSDRFQTDVSDRQGRDVSRTFTPLPAWLAARVLRAGETVTWVYGPRFSPWCERYLTHPALFLVGLALGAVCLGVGVQMARAPDEFPLLPAVAAGGFVLGPIFVLAIASGYFTRLVVTNHRLVILQGREVCRSWRIDDLPLSLIRYGRTGAGAESRAVDLGALQTMLGGSSDKFAESKTILAFGKQLDQIKGRQRGRP
jgi:hypothetical protein